MGMSTMQQYDVAAQLWIVINIRIFKPFYATVHTDYFTLL